MSRIRHPTNFQPHKFQRVLDFARKSKHQVDVGGDLICSQETEPKAKRGPILNTRNKHLTTPSAPAIVEKVPLSL